MALVVFVHREIMHSSPVNRRTDGGHTGVTRPIVRVTTMPREGNEDYQSLSENENAQRQDGT